MPLFLMVELRNLASAICPESELLLCCARTHISDELAERVRALARQQLDWNLVLSMARIQSIRPLIYWQLKTICSDLVSPEALDKLKEFFNRNLHRNLQATSELIKIVDLLGSQDISVIPYKGPALTALAYGNLGFREFIDLDILVRSSDVWQV
ncbi:MAG TPA: nucleotidyltransferase family protein, partial [Blastocatellia bacterium]|nr:nucleotidyltransferase family protein [Blastocatellia bacterium]